MSNEEIAAFASFYSLSVIIRFFGKRYGRMLRNPSQRLANANVDVAIPDPVET